MRSQEMKRERWSPNPGQAVKVYRPADFKGPNDEQVTTLFSRVSFPRLDGREELVEDGACFTTVQEPVHGPEDLQ